MVGGFNAGGLLIRFFFLLGFLPYPILSLSHSYEARNKNIQEIARALLGSIISIKNYVVGCYHLTGLLHVSEVSWDLIQDVRDILSVCDEVRVKIINLDRETLRMKLSIRQLEEDPLLETLEKHKRYKDHWARIQETGSFTRSPALAFKCTGRQFTLLAQAGSQGQEILLTTSLDQGLKKALQRVLECLLGS